MGSASRSPRALRPRAPASSQARGRPAIVSRRSTASSRSGRSRGGRRAGKAHRRGCVGFRPRRRARQQPRLGRPANGRPAVGAGRGAAEGDRAQPPRGGAGMPRGGADHAPRRRGDRLRLLGERFRPLAGDARLRGRQGRPREIREVARRHARTRRDPRRPRRAGPHRNADVARRRWRGRSDRGGLRRDAPAGAGGAAGAVPLGRFLDPSEVADLIVLVASPKAAGMLGSRVVVDGRLSPSSDAGNTIDRSVDMLNA